MLKSFVLAFGLVTASFSLCFAALPPLYQSSHEIIAVLQDPELSKYLTSGEPIMKIERSDDGWRIVGLKHTAEVKVNYLPQDMPGPAKFKITWK